MLLNPNIRLSGRAGRAPSGWVLAYGLIVVLIGLLALANPVATGLATGVLLGLTLLAYGAIAIASGLSSLSRRGRWIEILLGALGLITGIFILFAPLAGALSLVWMIGFWLALSGLFQIVSTLKGTHDRGWRLMLGVLDLMLGGVLLISGPTSSLGLLAAIVGVSFLFRGAFLILLAITLRRLSGKSAA